MKEPEGRHIVYYDFMYTKVRPIRKPRYPDHERDIDRIFDDFRKMFEGDKGYSNRRYQKTHYGKSSSRGKASDQRVSKGYFYMLDNWLSQC